MLTIYVLVIFTLSNGTWEAKIQQPQMTQETCDTEKRRINTLGKQKAFCYPVGESV